MKNFKFLILALLLVCLAAAGALAGVTVDGLIVEIVPEALVNYDLNDYVPGGMVVDSIIVKTSAANDVICFREGSATGPKFLAAKDLTGGGLVWYTSGGVLHPYLKWSDCTFSTPANVIISIKMR